jgi:hypothetical protein
MKSLALSALSTGLSPLKTFLSICLAAGPAVRNIPPFLRDMVALRDFAFAVTFAFTFAFALFAFSLFDLDFMF